MMWTSLEICSFDQSFERNRFPDEPLGHLSWSWGRKIRSERIYSGDVYTILLTVFQNSPFSDANRGFSAPWPVEVIRNHLGLSHRSETWRSLFRKRILRSEQFSLILTGNFTISVQFRLTVSAILAAIL